MASELDPARQALEQRKSKMCLERADLIADRTGCQAQFRGRGGETRGPGGRLEGPEPGQSRQTYDGSNLRQGGSQAKN